MSDTPFTMTEVPTDYRLEGQRASSCAARRQPPGRRTAIPPARPAPRGFPGGSRGRGVARRQGLPAGQGAVQVSRRRAGPRRRRPLRRDAVPHRPVELQLCEARQPRRHAAVRRDRAQARRPRVQQDRRADRHHGQQRLLRRAREFCGLVHAAHGRQPVARHDATILSDLQTRWTRLPLKLR